MQEKSFHTLNCKNHTKLTNSNHALQALVKQKTETVHLRSKFYQKIVKCHDTDSSLTKKGIYRKKRTHHPQRHQKTQKAGPRRHLCREIKKYIANMQYLVFPFCPNSR